jgi:hypothetical protein
MEMKCLLVSMLWSLFSAFVPNFRWRFSSKPVLWSLFSIN